MFNQEKPIKQVINELFKTYKLTGKIDEMKIWSHWTEIMGTLIAKNTSKISLKGQTLLIYVESAPLKNELNYHRSVILQKVNTFFEKEIIKEIQIK
jgi:predicted nucleic acid-binding Zn ribbon protein